MVSLIQALILSIIQGITEWFPISSSGHLALMQQLFGFQNLSFDVFLHLASVFAVIIVFRKEIFEIFHFKNKKNLKYLFYIFIALIPAAFFGFFLRERIESLFSRGLYLGMFFIFSGIIVYSTKFVKERKKTMNFFDSVFIGFFQVLGLFPGISRSGMTISSGLFMGLSKKSAITFSFLLAIPLILGANILELKDLALLDINYSILLVSFVVTFFISLFTINLLIKIIKSEKFYLFGIYNFLLGFLVLVLEFIK